MNDGEHYTVAEGDAIVRYAYATGDGGYRILRDHDQRCADPL